MTLGLDHGLAAATLLGVALSMAVWRIGDDGADPADQAAIGAELFHSKGCAACHDGPGWTSMVGAGPSLGHAAAWAGDRRDGWSAQRYLTESIEDPGAWISPAWPGAQGPVDAMPQLDLDDDEAAAVVAFLVRG